MSMIPIRISRKAPPPIEAIAKLRPLPRSLSCPDAKSIAANGMAATSKEAMWLRFAKKPIAPLLVKR